MPDTLRAECDEILRLDKERTPWPWAWDSRGDKDLDCQIGTAYGPDDKPIAGFVPETATVVYVDDIARVTSHTLDAAYIVAAANAAPRLARVALAAMEANQAYLESRGVMPSRPEAPTWKRYHAAMADLRAALQGEKDA